jgi:hypothetical protein
MPIGNKPWRKSWRIPLGWRSLRGFRMRSKDLHHSDGFGTSKCLQFGKSHFD